MHGFEIKKDFHTAATKWIEDNKKKRDEIGERIWFAKIKSEIEKSYPSFFYFKHDKSHRSYKLNQFTLQSLKFGFCILAGRMADHSHAPAFTHLKHTIMKQLL